MNNKNNPITVWRPLDVVEIPASAITPNEIVKYGAETLSTRDIQSIITGFQMEGYEMVSTFIWTKAAVALKKQVATLGMQFIGEMLGRPDLTEDSNPTTAIADHEVIELAEDLGMITSTQALRLKQSFQLVTHFASMDETRDPDEMMNREEALNLLRTSITSILGKPRFEGAIEFADFRKRLGEQTLQRTDDDVKAIKNSPYFFIRTTLSVLLSMIKVSKGASLEHAIGNAMILIPVLWERLRSTERWQIGQAYAEVNATGNRPASAGIKKALIEVQGFDFVPETLRSSTFTEAAARVLSVHFASGNFYHEREAIEILANLGSTIPMPAFAKCMEATLAVRLGNRWGNTWDAQSTAQKVLDSLRPTQWEYYFNECLANDRTVLDKLAYDKNPIDRWRELVVSKYISTEFRPKDKRVQELLDASRSEGSVSAVMQKAEKLRSLVGK